MATDWEAFYNVAQGKRSPAKPKRAPKASAIEPSGSYDQAEGVYHLTAPIKVISEANQREHWSKKATRRTIQQNVFRALWNHHVQKIPKPPVVVVFTRIGQKKLDDDNLANGFKGLRDQLAWMIDIDDGSDLIHFEYRQIATGKRQYGIKVEVRELGGK